ncbi:hypothetical protein KC950_02590 [Candidatus Saccharibacteria bacterium]|nr:hypothetical protein [Candidatus Saccharibacteria bacterium]
MSEISKQVARVGANSLSIGRGVAGLWLAHELRTTQPKDRDWVMASKVASLVITDTIDGKMGRYANPSRLGSWLDQMSDKAFVLPPMITLANKGEIADYHWQVKLGRDIGVTALRSVVHLNGGSTAAETLGKMKATAEMTGLVVASSPLAIEYPELSNKVFESATILNLASGAQYMQAFGSFTLAALREQNQEQASLKLAKQLNAA